jgi:hypothetical protein
MYVIRAVKLKATNRNVGDSDNANCNDNDDNLTHFYITIY